MDAGISPQPCQLPLGVLPRPELDLLHSLRLGGRPIGHRQKLLEADGLQGRGVTGQAAGQQLPHLVQKALFHHNVHSPVNAVTQLLPIPEA